MGLPGGRLVDLAAPGTRLGAAALDHLLEALEVALDAPLVGAERAADRLDDPFRLEIHLHHDLAALVLEPVECDDPRVVLAVHRTPRDALVGMLLGDLRLPLL